MCSSKENLIVKNHEPEFALGQADAAAHISAPLGCFVTAARGYFDPPPFHNVNIVLDVQMQTLITILIIPTLSTGHSFCPKYA